MSKQLSPSHLSQLSALIAAKMGLHFPEARQHDLERGLKAAAAACGFADVDDYCQSLLAASLTSDQIEDLSIYLTVGETYFFREKPAINALREYILPELIRTRRDTTKQLRVWSAGCCTGEEAYSSAILLNQLLPDHREWMLTILATDLNPRFLEKAAEGVYGEWSFRDIPPNIKERYFTPTAAGRYQLLPAIKEQVRFELLNLVEDSYPSPQTNTTAMDLIFCRNVLMYFSPEQAKRVVRKLYDSLVDGGWLIVSLGEASHQLFADFKMVQFPNAILYQKQRGMAASVLRLEDGAQEEWHKSATPETPSLSSRWSVRPLESNAPALQPRQNSVRHANVETPQITEPSSQPEAEPTKPTSQALVEQGRYAEAEVEVKKVLAEKPEDAASLALLARICANQRRLDEALEWCKRALAADRLNLRGHYLYATIQEERGESGEAIQALKRALYLYPEFVLAHFGLGYLAQRQGKQREADKHFANMFSILKAYRAEEILPESDGLTAGRLAEMVRAISPTEKVQ